MARPLRAILCTTLFTGILLAQAAVLSGTSSQRPIVILISIDGWRWDYLGMFNPPVIGALARSGVTADGLIPIFPSKTFPNHYTIVTGQHAARHGIVSNNMVDPHLPMRFALSDRAALQDTRWWGGEPLWVTVERQGQRAATMFWPGSDSEIAGDRPTHWKMFDDSFPAEARIDQMLAWLETPDPERPTFLTLYFSDVDTAGHDFGPDAEETRRAALAIDRVIGRLVEGIRARGLADRTNYVLVSDHGMAPLSRDRVIVLDDYLDLSTVDIIDSAPIVGLNARPGVPVQSIVDALADKHPAMHVFTRDTLPEQHRLRAHPRVADVIGIVDDGWHPTTKAWLTRNEGNGGNLGGNHGYEPRHRSMHGLFVASGPQFKSGLRVPAFDNVHVYELLCRVLGVRPSSNDGDPAVTASFLR